MNQINETRVALSEVEKDIGTLGTSRELSLALTNLQQGRMLLGNVLGLMGSPNPYPQSDNPESTEVAPATDVAPIDYTSLLPSDPIAAVKTVRASLANALADLDGQRPEIAQNSRESIGEVAIVTFDAARNQLILSKNWLGMELSRIAASTGGN